MKDLILQSIPPGGVEVSKLYLEFGEKFTDRIIQELQSGGEILIEYRFVNLETPWWKLYGTGQMRRLYVYHPDDRPCCSITALPSKTS